MQASLNVSRLPLTLLHILKLTPVQLCLIVAAVALFGDSLPHPIARGAYTLSLLIKDIIMNVLPIVVVVFIASTLVHFKNKALVLVGILIVFEGLSNALSVMYAYAGALSIQHWIHQFDVVVNQDFELVPFFQLGIIPIKFWSSTTAVMIGTAFGLLASFLKTEKISAGLGQAKGIIEFFFRSILSRLIPFYVLGFMVFMQHSGLLTNIIQTYGYIITYVTLFVLLYIFAIFGFAAFLGKNSFVDLIKNILPTGMIAATSMSSVATMPFTIDAAEKNLRIPGFASMLIPATTNIQQIGDCIANAFLCLVIMKNFNLPLPDLSQWLIFVSVFTLARYTTAAVLGGAIYLMIPIYKTILGFNDEMIAVILALNIVLDPIITATNVMANGGLAIVFERLWLWVNSRFFKHKNTPI